MNNNKVYNLLLATLFDLTIGIMEGNLSAMRRGTTASVLGPRVLYTRERQLPLNEHCLSMSSSLIPFLESSLVII